MSYDNLPPGTNSWDSDAPWNAPDLDGADEAHGIEQVTGGDAESTAETFSEFMANHMNNDPQKVLTGNTWLRENVSNDDLLGFLLADKGTSQYVVLAALGELRARYLAAPYTRRVIGQIAEQHANEVTA
jgi:hypothetical protein